MSYVEHPEIFGGLPVVDLAEIDLPDGDIVVDEFLDDRLRQADRYAWRLAVDEEADGGSFAAQFKRFVAAVGPSVRALLIGEWGEAFENNAPIGKLVKRAASLPNLRALFIGDMVAEECEISWIQQDDITPVLAAFPALEELVVRGAEGLELSPVRHAALRTLVIESGGLPGEVVRAVGGCDLPALTHLELWLGTDDYGGDATAADLSDILAGTRLPALRHLGLRDAAIADQVAAAVATAAAPVVARLESLDLSMGVLSDAGAEALLAGQPLTHLKSLNLAHHYMSADMAARVVAELPGVAVDVSDAQSGDDDRRWIAVSE